MLFFRRGFSRIWVKKKQEPEKATISDRYNSKSAFKLLELNSRYKFLTPGLRVLDLGATPGGWSQVAVEAVKSTEAKPQVFSVDVVSGPEILGSTFILADVTDENSHSTIMKAVDGPVDVILNDMSVRSSGDRDIDCATLCSLTLDALSLANYTLKPGGNMLTRVLNGIEEPSHYV